MEFFETYYECVKANPNKSCEDHDFFIKEPKDYGNGTYIRICQKCFICESRDYFRFYEEVYFHFGSKRYLDELKELVANELIESIIK